MDAAVIFARHVAGVRFEDIPADAIETAKMLVLDTLGIVLAASTLGGGCREVAELVKEGGGKQESTIIGFGGKAPSWMAAFANGVAGHSLEYDDVHDRARIHTGAIMVPASFAVAERIGKVNGKTFLTAVILGIDLAVRLTLAVPRVRGWHPTSVHGFFGAAAAASKILGLDADRVQHALGIAYSQAAGNDQGTADAALSKRLQLGFAAKGGVLSALLAEKGITGAANSLEGEFGLYKVYRGGKYDPAALTSELGKRFEASNLSFKPYPCGRSQQTAIDGVLEIVREHNIRPQDVESVTIFKGTVAVRIESTPIEKKRRPESVVDAQFSQPYSVATAIVKRRVALADYTPEAIKDAAVREMAQKVNVQVYPEFPEFDMHPAITEIRTKEGKMYSRRLDEAYGNPQNPMSRESLIEKFMDCASHSIKPLTKGDVNNVIEMVMELEKLDDVGAIVRPLG